LEFEALARQWHPLLHRYASWHIKGVDYDDIYQELLLTLNKASEKYDPTAGAQFSTYINRAFGNTLKRLNWRRNGVKSRIPATALQPLEDLDASSRDDELIGLIELMVGASPTAREVGLYITGYSDEKLTDEQVQAGLSEFRTLLGGINAQGNG